jgi:cytochrome c oxidase assembly factor CtaG
LTALIYLRGWYLLRCAGFTLIPRWRVGSFLSGLAALWIALAGPMDVFNSWLLTAHMAQHMMLMMVAPPLLLLGDTLIPVVRGMPVFAAREFAGPFLNWRLAQRVASALTHPVFALVMMGIVMLGWHIPALYELAVRSIGWHQFEHACFFITSVIFWWPVIQPWPSHSHWSRWAMVPYLVIADLQNTLLFAALVFAERVLYPSYSAAPRVFGLSTREDQAAAGAIMWVVGSAAFLIPALLIAVQCLTRRAPAALAPGLKKRKPLFAGAWRETMARFGIATSTAEVISFVALFVAIGAAFTAALAFSGPDDDALVLRARRQVGSILVSVYTPEDFHAGTNGVGFLVQNEAGEPLLDAHVELNASLEANGHHDEVKGDDSESENKLMQAVSIDLPNAGAWLLHVNVRAGNEHGALAVPVQATIHEAGFGDWWPYFIFPAFAIVLLAIYLWRAHRRPPLIREHEMQTAASNS